MNITDCMLFTPSEELAFLHLGHQGDAPFSVQLANPSEGTVIRGGPGYVVDGQGTVTIYDNDPQPSVSINDASVIVGYGTYGTMSGRATVWILYPKCQD